ncbi:MAG: PAS domain S-box protein [Candidatus Sumerlaeota bacterium]|nr:PAS domain S-box protein [Candidatus Sumerlaeota bacterium]
MTEKATQSDQAAELRRRAEATDPNRTVHAPENMQALSPAEARQALHELQVHQIELEMQNEELRRTQAELECSRTRYFSLYDLAPVGYFTFSEKGLIQEANLTAAALLGVARSDLARQPISRYILPEDQDIYCLCRKQLFETGAPQVCELRMLRADAAPVWTRLEATAAQDDDGASICRAVLSDITERKRIEEAQLFLLQCGYSGEDFFKTLAQYLARSLEMDYVCIDRLHGDGLSAQTVAVYFDGKFEDNVSYALKDTPCGDAVGKTICCLPKGVRNMFPQDVALQEMLAESYVGTTLWSHDGKPIGLIAVIGRKPLVNPRMAESLLKLVSIRAAGELERRQAEEALSHFAETLEIRIAERTQELELANASLEQSAAKLRNLAVELMQAEERERKRLAAILHDHLQQFLVAAKFKIDALKRHALASIALHYLQSPYRQRIHDPEHVDSQF